METNRLRYFCTIAETGSLTKASELLGISHSGLSKAVSVLQDETGLQLFKPQGRGLEITPDGKWFYKKAQEILKIENEIAANKKTESVLSVQIGLSEVIAITCAGALAGEFKSPLKLIETDVGEVEGKIIAAEIDFGIVFSIAPRSELDYLELGEIKFNSFARKDLIEKNASEEIPFVVPATDFPFNPLGYKIRDGWPNDVPRNPCFAVSGFSIALDLLQAGEAAVYMPNFVAALKNENAADEFQILKVPQHKKAETKRKLFLIKLKSADESKEMKKAAKVIRKVCSEK